VREPVISLMESQQHVTDMGGTMRLGAYRPPAAPARARRRVRRQTEISERHRHRYEWPTPTATCLEHGLAERGSPDGTLVEIVELPDHPWFVGCQFHPELKSRPTRPHPLFAAFIEAAGARTASTRVRPPPRRTRPMAEPPDGAHRGPRRQR
jgi:CTP synthase